MTNRTARNRPRADRAKRKRVARNRSERTRVVRIRAKRTRVARDRAEHTRVVRDRAERTRVVCIRAERTRSRSASVRAFVERLNAQPYELFKPRHRPPLSSRQFSLSTRVQPLSHQQHSFDTYSTVASLAVFLDTRSTIASPTAFFRHLFNRCLIDSISRHLFNRCLIDSISRHAFNLCLANAFLPVHATLGLLNCCQAAFASSTVISPLLPHHPLSSLCWHSAVVGQWGGMGSLPSVSHSRRTNGREAEMSLSSWRWIWSNQDLSNQDGNEDANNN